MNKPLKQLETRVWRTYKGGKLLDKFLGKQNFTDSEYPEDWISSFVAAKNKVLVENEGITRVETDEGVKLINEVITSSDFGEGRDTSGVLIKYLDAAERLGIQVHPTKDYALKYFNTPFGKTECWHILDVREDEGEPPAIYLGFKPYVTKELWRDLFEKQDIEGMLEAMHKLEVKPGDTVLVKGGVPHAIGANCFLLEIQEPTDYTMRVERVTVAGDTLTDMQMHYGVGFDAMLDCFDYTPLTREEILDKYFLTPKVEKLNEDTLQKLVTYSDTPCFKLEKVEASDYTLKLDSFVTLIILNNNGTIKFGDEVINVKRADKVFVPSGLGEIKLNQVNAIICYPPQKETR